MLFADSKAVVSIDDDQLLIDGNGCVAAVLQDVPLQRRKLLRTERREQLFHLRQDDRRPLVTCVFGFVFCKIPFLSV